VQIHVATLLSFLRIVEFPLIYFFIDTQDVTILIVVIRNYYHFCFSITNIILPLLQLLLLVLLLSLSLLRLSFLLFYFYYVIAIYYY